MKLNKEIWLKYIKTYESFNKEIPEELKVLFNKIRKIIGEPTSSFSVEIDLNSLDFCDLIIDIDVIFTELNSSVRYEDKNIIYYSNVNINDLISGKSKTKIFIRVDDIKLNIDKLCSVISHEIRHIYDIFTINEESDMKSFIDSLYYTRLSRNETDIYFSDFLKLVYLSLEHELIARNTMIWEMFIYCKCSKEELYKLYESSFMYKSINILSTFKSQDIIKQPNIIMKVNNFINYFGGDICENEDDVIGFFKNWEKYFLNKSAEYLKEGYKVLNDILKTNESIYNIKPIRNVKDILLDIYKKYIINQN